MGYAQRELYNQLAIIGQNKDFGSFDVNNISAAQMNKLRTDVYGGFKTKATPKYETRGAGRDGMRKVQTGYDQTFDADYYKNQAGWSAIGSKLGISNINSQNDVRQLYDFVNGYKPPAADEPAPAAAPGPLTPTISDASKKYRAETEEKLATIDKKLADFNVSEVAAAKSREIAEQTSIRNFGIERDKQRRLDSRNAAEQRRLDGLQVAEQERRQAQSEATRSANLARSNQIATLQIQPASSTPKTAGTQPFKKRRTASNRKQQLTSGINLGTSGRKQPLTSGINLGTFSPLNTLSSLLNI